jgi:hypothetical protein
MPAAVPAAITSSIARVRKAMCRMRPRTTRSARRSSAPDARGMRRASARPWRQGAGTSRSATGSGASSGSSIPAMPRQNAIAVAVKLGRSWRMPDHAPWHRAAQPGHLRSYGRMTS